MSYVCYLHIVVVFLLLIYAIPHFPPTLYLYAKGAFIVYSDISKDKDIVK